MPKGKTCVKPRIGERIGEYNEDGPAQAKRLAIEERCMFEIHLIRCPFCRNKLDLRGRMSFETMLVLSGFFLDDPVLFEKRQKAVKRFFQNRLSLEEFRGDWLGVSKVERQKIKSFLAGDC